MGSIRSNIPFPVTVNTGALNITTTPDNNGTASVQGISQATDGNIAAGATLVIIKNLAGSNGSAFANIDVNGITVEPGQEKEFEAYRDTTTNPPTLMKLPAFAITSNGAYWQAAVTR